MNGCGIPEGTWVRIVAGNHKGLTGLVAYDPGAFVVAEVDFGKRRRKGSKLRRMRLASVEVIAR